MRKVILIAVFVLGAAGLLFWLNQRPLPQTDVKGNPDAIARNIEKAVDLAQWQALEAVYWEFNGKRSLLWDKKRHFCQVKWAEKEAIINLSNQQGLAWENGKPLEGEARAEALQMAWKYWINDSFWLNPLAKLFDEGTERHWVKLDDGAEGLKVTYNSGGVTPGDSYVWLIDAQNRPTECRMWVSNIAVKGIAFSWEDWATLKGGALVACTHKNTAFNVTIGNLKSGTVQEIAGSTDPFATLQ